MARWEPGTRVRLVDAAVELFARDGYEATTVAQIAALAGVSKMTFFRHFTDKREVLFAGQAQFELEMRETVVGAEGSAFEAVCSAVLAVASTFPEERREPSARLEAVVRSHADLLERSAFKQAALTQALEEGLLERGVAPATAGLAADLGGRALHEGFARWQRGDAGSLTELTRSALDELREAAGRL
ncbi:TetR/AcrR family transcriptional regulator [Kineosporia succinea]|uniref:AcrR family transcriptional regulator n=1 Tax=Kineosporia succinea TaxID=84632 RepID=A0ABT9P206_9ACTN|nr:TetR/AcrR family transcriptional regulator [Kineosporia succinea]MDP9826703.1 AcrR family transcriptional regulator [Kineosporia succinea]